MAVSPAGIPLPCTPPTMHAPLPPTMHTSLLSCLTPHHACPLPLPCTHPHMPPSPCDQNDLLTGAKTLPSHPDLTVQNNSEFKDTYQVVYLLQWESNLDSNGVGAVESGSNRCVVSAEQLPYQLKLVRIRTCWARCWKWIRELIKHIIDWINMTPVQKLFLVT